MSLRNLLRRQTPPPLVVSWLLYGSPPLAIAILTVWFLASPRMGHSVSPEDKAPSRVVTIAPNAAEIIWALGAADRVVGVSKFCVYPPELTTRPRVGGLFDPDLERIIALQPDLVVLRGRCEAVERLCNARGIPIYHDQTDTLAGIELCVRDLGRRLGREAEADALVTSFSNRMEDIRRRVQNQPRPRVLLTISRQPDRLADILTTGEGTFLDQMLEVAGGKNVFGHLEMIYPQVSPEGIVARQPEVIIELMPEFELTEDLKQQMLDLWTTLGSIPAVTNERIYFLTDQNALIPSPRYVEIIEKVSWLLHPELGDGP